MSAYLTHIRILGEHSPTALVARSHSKVLQSCQIRRALPVALILADELQGFTARISFRFQAAAEVLDFRISKNDPLRKSSQPFAP